MDWGEREKTLRGGAPPTAPLPEKGSTTKKSMNACRKGTMVHAVFIVYAAGWHSCQPTGGRISQLPSRSIFGITTKTCTTRRFSHDHHASTMTIWNVSQSLSPASLGQRFSLWGEALTFRHKNAFPRCGGTARPGYLNAYLIKKVRTPSGKPGWGTNVSVQCRPGHKNMGEIRRY